MVHSVWRVIACGKVIFSSGLSGRRGVQEAKLARPVTNWTQRHRL